MYTTLGSALAIQTTSTLPTSVKTLKPMIRNDMEAASAAATPAWVPWAVGAAIGGVALYFLVRR